MATNNAINEFNPQPLFFAYLSANISNCTGDGTVYGPIAFNTVRFDNASSYNNGIYTFTAPYTAKYFLQVNLLLGGITANHTAANLAIVTTARTYSQDVMSLALVKTPANQITLYADAIADMTAGDTATISLTVSATDKTISILQIGVADPRSWFAGYEIR